jgi:hypothetical protein
MGIEIAESDKSAKGDPSASDRSLSQNRREFLFGLLGVGVAGAAATSAVLHEPAPLRVVREDEVVKDPQSLAGSSFECCGTLRYLGMRRVPVLVGGFPMSSSAAAQGHFSPITRVHEERPVYGFGPEGEIPAFRDVDTILQLTGGQPSALEVRLKDGPDSESLCKVRGRIDVRDGQPYLIFTDIEPIGVPKGSE